VWAFLAAPTTEPASNVDRETIEEIASALQATQSDVRERAIKDAAQIGGPIVPALLEMIIDKPGQGTFAAECALKMMGEKARPALPRLLKLVQDGPSPKADPPKVGNPPRLTALQLLRWTGWAADEVVPVLQKVIDNPAEEDAYRSTALSALSGMGKPGLAALRKTADGPESNLRETARAILAQALQEQGIQTRAEYYTALVEADLLGPHTPEYLKWTKTRVNMGEDHPLTQKVKAAYRARLKEKPDAKLALALAEIIQDGLSGTNIDWAAPTDEAGSRWRREDPAESYATLADVLILGLKQADKGSETYTTLATALAKLRLLQGDWEAMNKVFSDLGWPTVSADARPWLAAPPTKWGPDLNKQWTAADEKMRSGQCGLIVRVEKDGHGLRGAHVLIKPAPKEDRRVFTSGIRADNLRIFAEPLGHWSFGYAGQDRPMTRYLVTDQKGEAKFEKLPEMDVKIEVLVPTANFPETARGWDLWMEVEPSQLQRAENYGGEGAADSGKPPAVVELQSGRTVEYPRLVVLPQLDFNVSDRARIDPEKLVLSWPAAQAPPGRKVEYELDMALTGPNDAHANAEHMPAIRRTSVKTTATRWPVGAQGIGGQKLAPGHIYTLGLIARDDTGAILGRSIRTSVWAPWQHRPCDPPVDDSDNYKTSPIQVETWHLGNFGYGDGRSENLKEKVERFLREYPKAFEREYVQVGKAWLDWDAGDKTAAQKQLEDLVKTLPAGSIPQATARWLLDSLDNGDKPPQRLKLIAPPNATE
jgi:hypothetical protein